MAATSTEKNDMSKKLQAFRTRHVQEIKVYKEKQQKENTSKSTQQDETPMPNLIGERIHFLRKTLYKLTQDEFADLAHVSRNTIIRCEHDGVAPTMENLEKMVLHLCSIDEFTDHPFDLEEWKAGFHEMVALPPEQYQVPCRNYFYR